MTKTNKNIEMKKRLLVTIIRNENTSMEQYCKALYLLEDIDPELKNIEAKNHYVRLSAKLNIVPDFKAIA